MIKEKEIRADYDDDNIIIYQAFNKRIAIPAVTHQTFMIPHFKMERMTWIKPSFFWMMYRSGWSKKEENKQVLKIKISRKGFEEALRSSCLSPYNSKIHGSRELWKEQLSKTCVRVQWDPERNHLLEALNYRSIQIGLSGEMVHKYVNEWIVEIENITDFVISLHEKVMNKEEHIDELFPKEKVYQLSKDLEQLLGM